MNAIITRDAERFANNWQILEYKGQDPWSVHWMALYHHLDYGLFDVLVRDYVHDDVWYAPSDKPYKNRAQALAALGRVLDKIADEDEDDE